MGKLNDARHHKEKIEYFYNHAGERGYSQAVFHWDKLCDLARSAHKKDAPIIQAFMKSCQVMMDEMKERKDAHM